MKLLTVARFIKRFEEIAQTVEQKTKFSSGVIHFFLADITLLCLQFAKVEQLAGRILFVRGFANTYYSMLGLGDVKNCVLKKTIYVLSLQKVLWYLFVK